MKYVPRIEKENEKVRNCKKEKNRKRPYAVLLTSRIGYEEVWNDVWTRKMACVDITRSAVFYLGLRFKYFFSKAAEEAKPTQAFYGCNAMSENEVANKNFIHVHFSLI